MALSKSAKYYRSNPRARKVKAKTDAKINKRPEQVKKRVESNAKQREAKKKGTYKKNYDFDHAVGRMVPRSTNRGRAEKSRVKGSTRSL